MYVATAITIGGAALLTLAGYAKLWPLFGACNQLVAVPAFLAVACWFKHLGKKYRMFIFPLIFMLVTSDTALIYKFVTNIMALNAGTGKLIVEGVQCVVIVPIFILAIILTIDGFRMLFGKKQETKAEAA